MKNGQGKYAQQNPIDFCPNAKEKTFIHKKVQGEEKNFELYINWLDEKCDIFVDSNQEVATKILTENQMIFDLTEDNTNIKLIKERSSGPNIIDTEKTIFFQNENGSINKRFLKKTYAKVTVRKKKKFR